MDLAQCGAWKYRKSASVVSVRVLRLISSHCTAHGIVDDDGDDNAERKTAAAPLPSPGGPALAHAECRAVSCHYSKSSVTDETSGRF